MTETRVRPRQVLFLVILFCLILYYVATKTCDNQNSLQFESQNIIYAVTPTYWRPVQKAELTRLSHVIRLVPNIHWIIVEDANKLSSLVNDLINRAGLQSRSTILNVKTPTQFKLKPKDPNWTKARGVEQRNYALNWIRQNAPLTGKESVVYFMDDDNAYSVELFHEISLIEPGRVGVWPVGLVGGLLVEKPILDPITKKVIRFNSVWRPERPFPIDMAGFAISTQLLLKYEKASFNYEVQRGYQESEILRHLTIIGNLQPLANYCTNVLIWHTRTENPKLNEEEKLIKTKKQKSDYGMEV